MPAVEALEDRVLLSGTASDDEGLVTHRQETSEPVVLAQEQANSNSSGPSFALLENVTLLSGSPLHIPVDGSDPNGSDLTYTVTTDNPLVSAAVLSGNQSLRVSVQGYGDMVFELFDGRAPRATGRLKELSDAGFYDGVIFHRVIDNFMIQGGDPTGTGSGGSALPDFNDQFHVELQHNRSGLLSWAKSGDDTNNSQFFITEVPKRHLDYNHSIAGILIEGESVREAISNVATGANDRPVVDVVIDSTQVFVDNENAVIMLSASEGSSGTANVTVTVTDNDGNSYQQTFLVNVVPDTVNSNPFLADIPDIQTTVNTPVQFQLTAIDVEGDPAQFLDESTLTLNNLPVPFWSHADLDYSVDFNSGLVTVTPTNDLLGTHGITVATAVTTNAVDYQIVPIQIQPRLTVDAGSNTAFNEGSALSGRTVSFSDPGVDTWAATVNYGDGSGLQPLGAVSEPSFTLPDHTYADNGTYTVAVTVTDDYGASGSDTFTVTVNNVAPSVDAGSNTTFNEGSALSGRTVSFSDPGSDTWAATVNYGGGSGLQPLGAVSEPSFTLPDHTYADDGTYTVTVTVTDDDGDSSNDSFVVTVTAVNPPPTHDAIGTYKDGWWDLDFDRDNVKDPNEDDVWFYGGPGQLPVVGDWDGDGVDEIGAYDGGTWNLDTNGNGTSDGGDASFDYDWDVVIPGIGDRQTPVVGDWNGDGVDEVGVYAFGYWLRDVNGNRTIDVDDWQAIKFYGWDGAIPVVGDWKGDDVDELGVYAFGYWLRDVNGSGRWDLPDQAALTVYGWDGATPAVGDWDSDGVDDIAVYASGYWVRDVNASNVLDEPDWTPLPLFGSAAHLPIVGNWPNGQAIQLSVPPASLQPSTDYVTEDELQPIVETAIAIWGDAGASGAELNRLRSVNVSVADLSGSYLAATSSTGIVIDVNAAGYGWFVDPTPLRNEEFSASGSSGELTGLGRASSRVDLLTVIVHELGHVLGLHHDSVVGVMHSDLPLGVRRPLEADLIDAAFGSDWYDYLLQ